LHDLVRLTSTTSRQAFTPRQYPARCDDQPHVLMDGVAAAHGIDALASMPAFHVATVATLHATEAVPVHGPGARTGAIIIRTKRGR